MRVTEDHFNTGECVPSTRASSSMHAAHLEDRHQRCCAVFDEVDEGRHFQQGLSGHPARKAAGGEQSANFMPPTQQCGGQQQHHQQHTYYHPLAGSSEKGAGASGGYCAATSAAQDAGRDFPVFQRSRSGWDQTSGGVSHSNDLGMPLRRALSQGAGLDEGTVRPMPRGSAFLGGQQHGWETVEEKQQADGGGGGGGGGRGGVGRSAPGYFTALRMSSSTQRLQPTFSSRSGRTVHSTFSLSSSGEGYDDVCEQQLRVALGTRPSVSNVTGLVVPAQDVGGTDRADGLVVREESLLSKSSRAHHEAVAFMNASGRWQGADHGRSDSSSISTVSGSSSSGSFAVEGFNGRLGQQNQPLQPPQQNETANGGGGGAFNVARRAPAPYHGQRHLHHHYHHNRIDRRPAVSTVSAGRDGGVGHAFGRRVAANNMSNMEPLPATVGSKHRHIDNGGGVSESGSCPTLGRADSFSLSAADYTCTKSGIDDGNPMAAAAAAAMHSRSPAFGPSSSTVLQPPNNPLEWLQNFNLRQSRKGSGSDGNDEGTNTPRTSRSSSASSSPPCLGSRGGSALAVPRAGSAAAAAAAGACPAADCPANGDCLPGTTPDTLVYEVRFKRATRTFLSEENLDPRSISCGTVVKVEADRGEDLGTVHRSLPLSEYLNALREEKMAKAAKIAENGGGGGSGGEGSESKKKRGKAKKAEADGERNGLKQQQQQQQQQRKKEEEAQQEACPVKAIKRILRPANTEELQQLREKSQEEANILRVCQNKVRHRNLPMKIVDAEYQFDMNKLTLFFEAERRIDFRELVRDLFAVYKTRIWMQQVKDKDTAATQPTAPAAASASNNSTATPTACPEDSNGSVRGYQGREAAPQPVLLRTGDPPSMALEPALDTEHDSGYGSGSSSSGGSGISESDVSISPPVSWPAQRVAGGGGDAGKAASGSGPAARVDAKMQPEQQQQPELTSMYPDLLLGLDEITITNNTNGHRHHDHNSNHQQYQQQQQQQQEPASKPSYTDLLEGFDVGGIALSADAKSHQHPLQYDQHPAASSHPDFLDGFDFTSFF
ncbi:conserved unknown protein [Ectocarpus siliculosus]|uniref:PSP1 C-terminal domain-containing protein n=1 Tax=Ectocarpus siliculosus TaxID=2880 RepID=D8LEP0_ECTSI|nr:conserved unknown protein [Ectocarpus siliculosus]|eukprot:CBN78603.1 conserved unknown protein [Ectocarpus siliculosus]